MEGVYVLVENVRVAGECPTVRVSEEWVLGGRPLLGGGGGCPCKKDGLYEVEWSMLGCPC